MKYGEIVELGRHRLMCGDATKSEDVYALVGGERVNLVLTDPPYGMKCQDKHGKIGGGNRPADMGFNKGRKKALKAREYPQLIGDDNSNTARLHYPIARALCSRLIIWGGQYFTDFLPVNGGWIVWEKGCEKTDFSACELAWKSFGKRTAFYRHVWNGVFRQGKIALNLKRRVHPTQKPVELHAHILEDFSQEGDIILDCFGGSGTTLIASEITGRRCLMMEISPDYCDIIINRYKSLTEGAINFA